MTDGTRAILTAAWIMVVLVVAWRRRGGIVRLCQAMLPRGWYEKAVARVARYRPNKSVVEALFIGISLAVLALIIAGGVSLFAGLRSP